MDRKKSKILSSGLDTDCGCHEFYKEDIFRDLLTKERKRTERTNTPFTLVLINISDLVRQWQEQKKKLELKKLQKIIQATCSIMRETDIRGWYKDLRVIGIIFTGNDKRNEIAVQEKVKNQIWSVMNGAVNGIVEITTITFPVESKGSLSEIELKFYPETENRKWKLFKNSVKRLVDIGGSLLALLLFSPVFIVVPVLIRMESEGPVFYKQKRVGYKGKEFTLYKFRSMYNGSDDAIHKEYVRALIRGKIQNRNGLYKLTDDPRVTLIGKVLRRTSLDELPQFLNVLMGNMSLVGPRPAIPYETAEYLPWHYRRIMESKPGITGIWQVNGRSMTTFDTMVRMDLNYCKRRSVLLDVRLLLKTPFAIFKAKGAM
ncbi:MAG TPA: sugar transferase [Chitinispirillaceae bacterium]|nr:sugar transferase [Chitinispirillaceae bacterium]